MRDFPIDATPTTEELEQEIARLRAKLRLAAMALTTRKILWNPAAGAYLDQNGDDALIDRHWNGAEWEPREKVQP